MLVSGPNLDNLEKWRDIGASTTENNGEVVSKCDIIFICVKPHMLVTCAAQIENGIASSVKEKDKIFVSVLAGISLEQLENVGSKGMIHIMVSQMQVYFYELSFSLDRHLAL